VVADVVAERKNENGEMEYLFAWEDWPELHDLTWEPAERLEEDPALAETCKVSGGTGCTIRVSYLSSSYYGDFPIFNTV
jgi:hypothetical protein